jgi:hypothetical protein
MRTVSRVLSVMLLCGGVLAACHKGGGGQGGGGEGDVQWPDRPANGCPVTLDFVDMTGQGQDRGAHMRLFNFSQQPVQRIMMTLHYLDGSGQELDDFPFSMAAPSVVGANAQTVVEVGAFVPDATARVTAEVSEVQLGDGSTWSAPAQ